MMNQGFNPLESKQLFARPRRLIKESAWIEHVPFAMLLVELQRPRVIVELGTHYGLSYCAFCQAVDETGAGARCYAVDTWAGDAHSGRYGNEVFESLKAYHKQYESFSQLLRMTFDEALEQFPDASVDLLHIDGLHTYEAVTRDYNAWLPKMSERGIILFHDTVVAERDFGVHQLWRELAPSFPHFNFEHGCGLGVLAVGKEQSEAVTNFLQTANANASTTRELFCSLGHGLQVEMVLADMDQKARGLAALKATSRKFCKLLVPRSGSHHNATMHSGMRSGVMSRLRTFCDRLMVTAAEKIRDWRWKARLKGFFDPAKTIKTWASQRELRELYRLAASCPTGATVVEIGSWLGGSAIYLAAGLKQVHGRLVCVDTWNNETMPEGERDTYDEFERNISRVRDRIVPVRKRSWDLTQQDVGAEVALVLIDGDHSYEAVRRDFECILPMLSPQALVAFHDSTSGTFPGVSRFIGETLAGGRWFIAGNVEGLTSIRRGPLPQPPETNIC